MPHAARVGLLPMYLELYDRVLPEMRPAFSPFLAEVRDQFQRRGVHVLQESICRTQDEFAAAVNRIEHADVDILVTLHLAYSPSLESVDVLARTSLPLLLLDTTMDAAFGVGTDSKRIQYNHGIHGVQDLASALLRRRRTFSIVAGHWRISALFDRAVSHVRSAAAARALRRMKVLRIGESFKGMGDFYVEEDELKNRLGIEVLQADTRPMTRAAGEIPEDEVIEEVQADQRRYAVEVSDEVHRRSVRAGLALRRVTDAAGCGACSFNFLAFESNREPLSTPPFLGASKMMAERYGYAGEGDVLTAALVGGLARSYLVNFTEMFCPDWEGNAIFLSHMGEFNPECAEGTVSLVEKDFPFTEALNPAILVGAMKQGPAVLVNLAPGPDDTFRLLAAPVDIQPDTDRADMRQIVRGWFRVPTDVAAFLEWYSTNGGTHHCALVHDASLEAIADFASYCGIPCAVQSVVR
ncbi:MAG: hypothetical protein IT365_15880 [Candidatus Hydrogenedentes bacterium]|nr:hypothetical protein [Candidatus Hydrogenedentota bacterium]